MSAVSAFQLGFLASRCGALYLVFQAIDSMKNAVVMGWPKSQDTPSYMPNGNNLAVMALIYVLLAVFMWFGARLVASFLAPSSDIEPPPTADWAAVAYRLAGLLIVGLIMPTFITLLVTAMRQSPEESEFSRSMRFSMYSYGCVILFGLCLIVGKSGFKRLFSMGIDAGG